MARKHDPEKLQRILEELDKLLGDASPPRNKKEYRAANRTQTEADLSCRISNSGITDRVLAHLDRLSFESKEELSQDTKLCGVEKSAFSETPLNSMANEGTKKSLFWISSELLSDAIASLLRLVLVDTRIGTSVRGLSDDGARRNTGRRSATSHFCTWKQDALQLTLSCLPMKPHTVTLHVDEGPDVELSELCWIDEDHLLGDPDRPVEANTFSLERMIDERTYRVVDMDVVIFGARMGAINAAREGDGANRVDVRLLLPFVN